MKKIPTLFERKFENGRVVGITDKVTPGMEWVLEGEGFPSVKIDGACCAIIDGVFYKRYDAKKGKTPPQSAIPCCAPDPVTGHWPHWVRVEENNPSDKWFLEAFKNTFGAYPIEFFSWADIEGMSYEAIGPHFNGNPYNMETDGLIIHGVPYYKPVPRTFEGLRDWLETFRFEGLVFWKDGAPQCKIKRSDFGFEWPIKQREA